MYTYMIMGFENHVQKMQIDKCMWYMLNVSENILNTYYNHDICKRKQRKFDVQILQLWSDVYRIKPKIKNDILNEYLLYKKNILLNSKMLEPNFIGKNCNVNLKLMDIYLQNGEIMSKLMVNKASGVNLTILKYNTLSITYLQQVTEKSSKLNRNYKRKKLTHCKIITPTA